MTKSEPAAIARHCYLGLPLDGAAPDALIQWLVAPDPAAVRPRAVAYLNAHTVNLSLRRGSTLGPLMQCMDLVYADGMSVVRAGRRRGWELPGRVSAADFFLRFCWAASAAGRSLALVGAAQPVLDDCMRSLQSEVPGLNIAYSHHGYFKDTEGVVAALTAARPDIVLLGMGSPRQEELALVLRDDARLPTTWCVGALFEYFAPGHRRRAPHWMRHTGLEWAFRLAMEPRRLASRYLLGNAEFLLRDRGVIPAHLGDLEE